jgi:uncharacterized damage-inducible protein DinB
MWHGPALLEVLKGVRCDEALARPLANAHTIWEIVLHVTAWSEIARQRLKGQCTGDPTPEQDWPAVSVVSGPTSDPNSDPTFDPNSDRTSDPESEWHLAVERLVDSHRNLAADTRLLSDERLAGPVQGLNYSVSVLLRGIVEHGTYHGGQIALLKKA